MSRCRPQTPEMKIKYVCFWSLRTKEQETIQQEGQAHTAFCDRPHTLSHSHTVTPQPPCPKAVNLGEKLLHMIVPSLILV